MTEKNMSEHEEALDDLIWGIEASAGEFAFILAHCNYGGLRKRFAAQLREKSPVQIWEITLPRETRTLYRKLSEDIGNNRPEAVMVQGLESLDRPDRMLTRANQVREEFRKNFSFPLILWVNDDVLRQFIDHAPDLKSWAGTSIFFKPGKEVLLEALRQNVGTLFGGITGIQHSETPEVSDIADLSDFRELEAFLKDSEEQKLDLTPELEASLQFLRGRDAEKKGDTDSAIGYYEASLSFWKQSGHREREGVLLYSIAKCCEQNNELEKAKSYFDLCIEAFAEHQEMAAKCGCELCGVLEKLGDWNELGKIAEKALELNQTCGDTWGCAECYRFMAQVALHKKDWRKAVKLGEDALDTPISVNRDKARLILAKAYRELKDAKKSDQPS